jgi:hypothetical protein
MVATGYWRGTGGEGSEDGEEMVCIFDVMDFRLEVGVNKSRDTLCDGALGRYNEAATIVEFMDFGKEVEWGCGDWGHGGGRCLGRKDHEAAIVLKEGQESLVVVVSRVKREKRSVATSDSCLLASSSLC